MIDIQHDSPVPIHEQITQQIMAHVAAGDLQAGTRLVEYRALAQQLLTNPQPVARAYADLEKDGVLKRQPTGDMEVLTGAAVICRTRLQDSARRRIRQAVAEANTWGVVYEEIQKCVDEGIAAAAPLSNSELQTAIKKPPHASSHRASSGIQVLSGQEGRRSAQPEDPARSDLRPSG